MSADVSRPASTTARSPFNDANADTILRTSDHVEFRVYRLILTLSSPFFRGMFALPQSVPVPTHPGSAVVLTMANNDPLVQSPPTIDVPEDSHTLDALLRILHPTTSLPAFRSIAHACNVALAASKYAIAPAVLDAVARQVGAQFVDTQPLRVYLLACRMGAGSGVRSKARSKSVSGKKDKSKNRDKGKGDTNTAQEGESDAGWESLARAAAVKCLDSNLMLGEEMETEDDDVLRWPGAGVAYHRLEKYRVVCHRALKDGLDSMHLSDDDDDDDRCGCCKHKDYDEDDEDEDEDGISGKCIKRWTHQYVKNMKQHLLEHPDKKTFDWHGQIPDALECQRCNLLRASDIASAQLLVAAQLEKVLSEVTLRFG